MAEEAEDGIRAAEGPRGWHLVKGTGNLERPEQTWSRLSSGCSETPSGRMEDELEARRPELGPEAGQEQGREGRVWCPEFWPGDQVGQGAVPLWGPRRRLALQDLVRGL